MILNDVFINVNLFTPEENNKNTTLIFTHGLGEYSKSYVEVANFFKEEGFNVITYDIRGHGKSSGKRGYVKSYKNFLDDLKELVNYAYSNTKKVFLVGHSMGGLITNLYTSLNNNIDGVIITASPTTYLKDIKYLRFVPKFLINNKKLRTNFSDEKLVHDNNYVVDGHDINYFYFKLINEMMFKAMRQLHKNIDNYQTSVLLIYSKNDKLAPIGYGEGLFNKLSVEDKELFLLEESRHNVFNDLEKELVFNKILSWVKERL